MSLNLSKRNTIALVSLGFIILVLAGIIASLSFGGEKNVASSQIETEKIKAVKGFRVKDIKKTVEYSFPASIKSEKEVKISFRVGGPIVKFTAETGLKVKKGELIAKIDQRDFAVNVENLNATLEGSIARLKDAELQYKRYKNLLKENAASKSSFDKFEALYKATKSETRVNRTRLTQAENALFDTKLRAPIDGYINQVFTENHETVSPGQPVFSIIDTSSIEVETFIPEQLISRVDRFENFSFSLITNPEKRFGAKIKEIGQKATGAGHTYPVTLKTDAKSGIKPGMSAMVRFSANLDTKKSIFTIPLTSIVSMDYKSAIVWKIDNAKQTPSPVAVKVLRIVGQKNADVYGDLKSGDWIVSAGANYINSTSRIVLLPNFSKTNVGAEL